MIDKSHYSGGLLCTLRIKSKEQYIKTVEVFHSYAENKSVFKVSPLSDDFTHPTWENAEADILIHKLSQNQ